MTKATFTKGRFVTRVMHFETSDMNKAEMIADMQKRKGEKVRVEEAE